MCDCIPQRAAQQRTSLTRLIVEGPDGQILRTREDDAGYMTDAHRQTARTLNAAGNPLSITPCRSRHLPFDPFTAERAVDGTASYTWISCTVSMAAPLSHAPTQPPPAPHELSDIRPPNQPTLNVLCLSHLRSRGRKLSPEQRATCRLCWPRPASVDIPHLDDRSAPSRLCSRNRCWEASITISIAATPWGA